MDILDDNVFQILCTVKRLADNGFLEPFLKQCGSCELGREDFYDFAWEAVGCVFPDATGYWNQENEIDTIVIFDPLVDEFCRLLAQYETACGAAPGGSDLRHEAVTYVLRAFDMESYLDGYYIYDYDFRVYDTGHGRKRLVFLSGIEFCGLQKLPGALADVHRALKYQVRQLRRELGVEQPTETKKKEAV